MSRRLLLILVLMGCALTVFAQAEQQEQAEEKELEPSYLYQWTDDKGIAHITDGMGKVPEKYRMNTVKIKQPDKDETQEGQQVRRQPEYYSGNSDDGRAKAQWQQRMRVAKTRLAAAERRYRKLDQQRNDLLRSWGGPASGRREGPVEAEKIEQEMRSVQLEIAAARNESEIVIPEEARKAGIPPGWLRE